MELSSVLKDNFGLAFLLHRSSCLKFLAKRGLAGSIWMTMIFLVAGPLLVLPTATFQKYFFFAFAALDVVELRSSKQRCLHHSITKLILAQGSLVDNL